MHRVCIIISSSWQCHCRRKQLAFSGGLLGKCYCLHKIHLIICPLFTHWLRQFHFDCTCCQYIYVHAVCTKLYRIYTNARALFLNVRYTVWFLFVHFESFTMVLPHICIASSAHTHTILKQYYSKLRFTAAATEREIMKISPACIVYTYTRFVQQGEMSRNAVKTGLNIIKMWIKWEIKSFYNCSVFMPCFR